MEPLQVIVIIGITLLFVICLKIMHKVINCMSRIRLHVEYAQF